MGFGFGFEDNLIDDIRLGLISGKKPAIIVMGDRFEDSFERFRVLEPEVYEHIRRSLHEFQPAFRNESYTIYVRPN
jgi:hypothetical protein